MSAQESVAADPTLQVVTLIVASVAATAAIAAAVISAITEARRERLSWLREQQSAAYEAVSNAAHDALYEVGVGEIDKAMARPGWVGVDEAWSVLHDKMTASLQSTRKLRVVGERRSIEAAMAFNTALTSLAPLAYPISAVVHPRAVAQRRQVVEALTRVAAGMDATFRYDLKVMSRRERRAYDESLREALAVPVLEARDPDSAVRDLSDWRVRNWDGEDAAAARWFRSDTPWAMLPMPPYRELAQPLAAMLIKYPDNPWRAAIDAGVDVKTEAAIAADMLSIVRHGGRGGHTELGGHVWLDGPVLGSKVWFWAQDDLPGVRTS